VESSIWAFAIGTSKTAHNNKRKRFNIPPRDWNLAAHLNAGTMTNELKILTAEDAGVWQGSPGKPRI
jgi:hypothetical protein